MRNSRRLRSCVALLVGASLSTLNLIPNLPGSSSAVRAATPTSNAMIHQLGGRIVDETGKPLQLKGVNLEGWLQWEGVFYGISMFTSGTAMRDRIRKLIGQEGEQEFEQQIYDNFITEDDIAKISRLGFNCVRLPITAEMFEDPKNANNSTEPEVYRQSSWELIDRALSWCQKYGVYVIIDLHSAPGGQSRLPTDERVKGDHLLWSSEKSRQRTVELWKAIAARYRDQHIVAGYDLLNEPLPPKPAQLLQLYSRIIEAIRSVDANHMVVLEGLKMASDLSVFDHPLCDNLMYSFHMYTWFGDNRRKRLSQYKAVADAQHVPLWVGEFGANKYEMIDSTRAMYDEMPEIVGWAYWPWKKAPTKYPGLATISLPQQWEPVAKWISLPLTRKPGKTQSSQALEALVSAVKLEHTPIDMRMLQILLPTPVQR